jgi:tRNA(Ile)-lysidine synthase
VALGRGEADLTFANLVAVAELLDDPVSGKIIQLPGGVVVEKRYQQLTFCNEIDATSESNADQVVVRVPGRTILPSRFLEICCEVSSPPTAQITELRECGTRLNEHLDLDTVHAPLLVRSRRPGERFWPLGAPGSKKLSDYLTDSKVPPGERRKIVVVCDQLGPIWVVGHRIDDRVKLTSRTRRVLRLEARELSC